MCAWYAGNLSFPGAASSGNLAMLTRVGTMAMPCAAKVLDRVLLKTGGVLDAVDAGGGEV